MLIPIGIWQLYLWLAAGDAAREVSQPAPEVQLEQPEPRQGERRLRRGERRAERERLERALADALAELRQVQMEQSRSPAGSWGEVIEKKQEEIAALQRRLEDL